MRHCKFDGCSNARHAHGLCHGHERQQEKGQPLTPLVFNRRWTCDEYAQIMSWREEGKRWPEIAEALNATVLSVQGLVNRGGPVAMCRFPTCRFQAHYRGLCGTHEYQRKRGIPLHAVASRKDEANDGLTAVQRRYRANRAAGLCVTCGKAASEDMATCRPCRLRAKALKRAGDEDTEEPADNTPRCRCGLRVDFDHLECDLPTTAAAWARNRVDGGDGAIVLRSKAA